MDAYGEVYLPDFQKCLAGKRLVTSWDDVFSELLRHRGDILVDPFSSFVACDISKDLLSQNGLPYFQPPSSASKNAFDRRTAPISVPNPTDDSSDLDEIKADALWLSKETKTDEVEALRITILEWQRRPKAQLQEGFSETELASLRDALGQEYDFQTLSLHSMESSVSTLDLQERRRLRILGTLLSERTGLLATQCELMQRTLAGFNFAPDVSDQQIIETSGPHISISKLGEDLFPHLRPNENREQQVSAYIKAVQRIYENMESGLDWTIDQNLLEHISRDLWIHNVKQLTYLIEIILLLIRSATSLLSTENVLSWFSCAMRSNFFTTIGDPSSDQSALLHTLQSSATIVTMAVLDPAGSIEFITKAQDRDIPQHLPDTLPYFLNIDAVKDIHGALCQAAVASFVNALPAICAWGMILYTMRDTGKALKEEREARHIQRAIEHGGLKDPQTGRRSSGSSIGSIQQSAYEDILDHIAQDFDDASIEFMIGSIEDTRIVDAISDLAATKSSPFSLSVMYKLQSLQDLVKMAVLVEKYTAETLESQLAILNAGIDKAEPFAVTRPGTIVPATLFVNNGFLVTNLFDISAARFPFETLPFLRFCRALLPAEVFEGNGLPYIAQRLMNMSTFTQEVTSSSPAFHTIREDENANLVSLENDLHMLSQRNQNLLSYHVAETEEKLLIRGGTLGVVISEKIHPVIQWFHSYSALGLLGAWLDLYRIDQLHDTFTSVEATKVVVSEVIELLSSLLSRTLTGPSNLDDVLKRENALALLDEVGSSLDSDDDIITIVFDIFEAELSALRHRLDRSGTCDILVACANFMLVITRLLPDRAWRALFRSSLVDAHGSDGALPLIIGSSETYSGVGDFFEACTLLYSFLVEDSLSHIFGELKSPSLDRLTTTDWSSNAIIAVDLMSTQLSSLTRAMLETLDSSSSSVWQSSAQRYRVNRNIFGAFEKLISYTFGVDDNPELRQKLTAVLAPSALYITQAYRIDAIDDASVPPPVRWIVMGFQERDLRLDDTSTRALEDCLLSSISLCIILVRLGDILGRKFLTLEKQLLSTTPAIIRLMTTNFTLATRSMGLMETLLAASADYQPASLLGRLGPTASKNLVELLCSFTTTGLDGKVKSAAWKLSRQLVGKNQQWFAMMLLTGSSPRGLKSSKEGIDKASDHETRGSPLLIEALHAIYHHSGNLDEAQIVPILQFIATAQENWIWAQNSLQTNSEIFFSTITAYVASFGVDGDSVQRSYQCQIAALVTQIWTFHLFQAKSFRDISTIKKILPLLNWLANNAIEVAAYNASLHANLRKNFAARYHPCKLDNFKHTALPHVSFGRKYFYDIDLANKILFQDQQHGSRNGASAGQSFAEELSRANLNLSLVQSQIDLLNSFKDLCVEHSASFAHDRELQKIMIHIVRCCIQANTHDRPPEQIFDTLFWTRADFALALIQPLVEAKAKGSDAIALLDCAWECLRYRDSTFESAILDGSIAYYRTNLSILLLAMQFHIQKGQRARTSATEVRPLTTSSSSDSTIMEVASLGIVEGFHTLVRSLHDQYQSSRSRVKSSDGVLVGLKDVKLLLNIVQSILRLPSVPHLTSQLSRCLSSATLIQSCIHLYSWSHVMTAPEFGDVPIYAETSLQFLASLSSLPLVAEELAVEGVLTVLSTSRITQSLRSKVGGVSQFDKQPHFQTLYRAWSMGILPLCLNLLHSVGRAMAGEVASFLNQFPQQLSRASNAFTVRIGDRHVNIGPTTLGMAHEAATLALISHILQAYRIAGASAGVDGWDIATLGGYDENKKELIDDIEDLLASNHKHLKARMVAVSDAERGWQDAKDGHILENKIVAELKGALICLKEDVESEAM